MCKKKPLGLCCVAVPLAVWLTICRVQAEVVIDYNTTIDYAVSDNVRIVEGANPNPPTIVDIVTGAILWELRVEDSSELNFFGGRLGDPIRAVDHSVVNFSGRISDDVNCYDFSTLNISGGECDAVYAYDFATVNVYDGEISDELEAGQHSTVNISGGTFPDGVYAVDSSTVNVSGGIITGDPTWSSLHAGDQSELNLSGGEISRLISGWIWPNGEPQTAVVTVYGTEFNYPYGPIGDSSGTLTGTLASGDLIDAPFEIYGDASIVLVVPEPASLVALGIAALCGLACARRHRKRN